MSSINDDFVEWLVDYAIDYPSHYECAEFIATRETTVLLYAWIAQIAPPSCTPEGDVIVYPHGAPSQYN